MVYFILLLISYAYPTTHMSNNTWKFAAPFSLSRGYWSLYNLRWAPDIILRIAAIRQRRHSMSKFDLHQNTLQTQKGNFWFEGLMTFKKQHPFDYRVSSNMRKYFLRWTLWDFLIFEQQQNFLPTAVTCQHSLCNLIRPSISKVGSHKLIFIYSLDTVEWVSV